MMGGILLASPVDHRLITGEKTAGEVEQIAEVGLERTDPGGLGVNSR